MPPDQIFIWRKYLCRFAILFRALLLNTEITEFFSEVVITSTQRRTKAQKPYFLEERHSYLGDRNREIDPVKHFLCGPNFPGLPRFCHRVPSQIFLTTQLFLKVVLQQKLLFELYPAAACGSTTNQRETVHLPSNLFAAPPPRGPQTNWKASRR